MNNKGNTVITRFMTTQSSKDQHNHHIPYTLNNPIKSLGAFNGLFLDKGLCEEALTKYSETMPHERYIFRNS